MSSSHMASKERIFIDLTDDTDMDEQPVPVKEGEMTFVSTVTHRQPPSVIPNKRKSVEDSDASSISNFPLHGGLSTEVRSRIKSRPPSTPSPTPSSSRTLGVGKLAVVISSPSAQQREALKAPVAYPGGHEFMGLSEQFYPTKSVERRKAAKRVYPKARQVDRRIVPFAIWAESRPESAQSSERLLRDSLNKNLSRIEGPPITFDIDDERLALLSSTFGFVNDYVLFQGVKRVDRDFNFGCNCDGPCGPTTCDCLFDEEDSDEKITTYHAVTVPEQRIVLHPKFLGRRSKIVECCELCSCKGQCWNTVVQRGRRIGFEIFDTGPRGFGIRSPDDIVAGQFIDRYFGEVITDEEADDREQANQEGQSYLFTLDWKEQDGGDYDSDDDSEEEVEQLYVIDGQKFGSATRFINHSCNPNCKIVPVSTTEHADDKLYSLAFFALRDIPPGTELTFDYNPFWDGTTSVDPGAVKCLCGEANCRGQLWPNARKKGPGNNATPNKKNKTKK
ncbi:hypothetical protein N7478_001001 [Penicillium angulare]|uniref:uncharacterized protein n=1 Tax=Penicillium angulare TaxID=116970 RepID=UPI0025422783|nr:uncharacterized protein N7478_001001 [Penicillium angulare]KAJ5291750.1 hypothetical protein N7478_001001 [Penicillium angulare]